MQLKQKSIFGKTLYVLRLRIGGMPVDEPLPCTSTLNLNLSRDTQRSDVFMSIPMLSLADAIDLSALYTAYQ
jgi:hypothetical protein